MESLFAVPVIGASKFRKILELIPVELWTYPRFHWTMAIGSPLLGLVCLWQGIRTVNKGREQPTNARKGEKPEFGGTAKFFIAGIFFIALGVYVFVTLVN